MPGHSVRLPRRSECTLTFAVFFCPQAQFAQAADAVRLLRLHTEQPEIIRKEESLLAKAAELENQIIRCEQYTKLRLRGIPKGAFEEK